MNTFKKSIVAAMGGLFLATGFAGAASAKTVYFKPGYVKAGPVVKTWHPKPYHPGYVGVGLGLGALAVGAAVASGAAYAAEECYIVRRPVSDVYGNVFIRRVQVCE